MRGERGPAGFEPLRFHGWRPKPKLKLSTTRKFKVLYERRERH